MNEVTVEDEASNDKIVATMSRLRPEENLVITIFREGKVVKLAVPASEYLRK